MHKVGAHHEAHRVMSVADGAIHAEVERALSQGPPETEDRRSCPVAMMGFSGSPTWRSIRFQMTTCHLWVLGLEFPARNAISHGLRLEAVRPAAVGGA